MCSAVTSALHVVECEVDVDRTSNSPRSRDPRCARQGAVLLSKGSREGTRAQPQMATTPHLIYHEQTRPRITHACR